LRSFNNNGRIFTKRLWPISCGRYRPVADIDFACGRWSSVWPIWFVADIDVIQAAINLFFYSVLRWSVAVSTMRRQSSRRAAFLQADARPMFCWPRSASTARSQVWLGLPNGRFQSGSSPGSPQRQHGGGPVVVSCGQYVQRAANVCQ